MAYSQDGRLISLSTPLGEDVLLLAAFSGHEAISRMFCFRLDLLTEQGPIDFSTIIGQSVTISLTQSDDSRRYINGIVSRFAATGADLRFMQYKMEVVPWTWKLTRYAECRIFHNKTVADILQQVFTDRGLTDFKISLSASYTPMEYCVQYRETDFNFISRLMEQNGIFYFFEHEQDKHTMVIADSANIHESCPGFDSAGYNLAAGGLDSDDVVSSWSMEQQLRSGIYTLTDYNFQSPGTSLLASESTVFDVGGNASFEFFDHPGDYATRADGSKFAKLRMQEEEAGHLVAQGEGVCRYFASGYKFALTDHPDETQNGTYLLTEVQHQANVAGTFTTSQGSGDHYQNTFSCIPIAVPFRPARITPRPFVQGPQTAVVVGKNQLSNTDGVEDDGGATEDIWVDKYGRVVVRFPWDRAGSCSCRVRVSQDWAGKAWGGITIPRVGQEVIVSFLEGDPDRPIITGRVYNADQEVPYKLPDYQTRSTFMTRSSPNGSAATYNELRFEDKKGAEQVFLRAQYDQDNYVTHDSREWVGNNRSLVVTSSQLESVGGDRHETISGNNLVKIGGSRLEQVGGNELATIGGNHHEQVGGDRVEQIGGDSHSTIDGEFSQMVLQDYSLQVGNNLYEKSQMNYAHEAGMSIHLKAGMSVVIEAGMELTLKAGGSFIDIGPAGIAISGTPMVMINSGGAGGSGSGSSPSDPKAPDRPGSPKEPDLADDGKSGTKRGGGDAQNTGKDTAALPTSTSAAGKPNSAGSAAAPPPKASESPNPAGGAVGAAAAAVSQTQQGAQQGMQQAGQAANQAAQQAAAQAQQAANQAQQAAAQAQQAAQQAEQQAQQSVNQVTQQARQAFNQANQAAQQAQQAADQAVGQAKAEAQQAANQAQQQAQQAAQQAAQAVQQARQQAEQIQQQAQQAAQQAQQQAQQAQQAAQQAQQQGEQAAQQAQQQAQQAAQQAQQAAQQAQQQAQQAGQQVQQAAAGAQQQAQQAAQAAQQSAAQAMKSLPKGF